MIKMKKISFNDNWEYRHLHSEENWTEITLPHDAMFCEKRSAESKGGRNVAWFEGRDYEYRKKFDTPDAVPRSHVFAEFEGVYHDARIYMNNKQVEYRPYGYTQIITEIGDYLSPYEKNEIRVEAVNSDQPNSRWYSGAGIYRPAWLYISEGDDYIVPYGIKIRTISHDPARIEVSVVTSGEGEVSVSIFDPDGSEIVSGKTASTHSYDEISENEVRKVNKATTTIDIENAQLWSAENPVLYRAVAKFGDDEAETTFGIRSLKWGSVSGLTVNGERVILRGACIHSDNQLLGAASYPEAEERRVRLLKKAGYNAIRSAHNPCSSSLLEACDRLGMYVLDEYADMWYTHKLKYDYAGTMMNWWHQDLHDMVDKDYSHPSVIMYSIGNEVTETCEERGIELVGEMTDFLHGLDLSRPVTCGVNIMLNILDSMGKGIYSNEKAAENIQPDSGQKSDALKNLSGSELFNRLAGRIGRRSIKAGAAIRLGDAVSRDAYEKLDIAGYNYGIDRYEKDLKKYPHRLILGTETFCSDAYRFWEMAKNEPRLVGDFVWAGMDYLGETAIGACEYPDYADAEDASGWIAAGSGRLDLTGQETGEALYTKVALEQERGPYLCVHPVYETGEHTTSPWKMTDAMPSWSWKGCNDMKARIEVYTRADVVELFLNGRRVGGTNHVRDGVATFKVPYEDGWLQAVTYDRDGNEMGAVSLTTAGDEDVLHLIPESDEAGAGKLAFLHIRYTDADGIWKPMHYHAVHVSVDNGSLVALGNACPYNPNGFLEDTTSTYYGQALAVVRVGDSGITTVNAEDTEGQKDSYQIKIVDDQQ
jgi:beta-galactosidase